MTCRAYVKASDVSFVHFRTFVHSPRLCLLTWSLPFRKVVCREVTKREQISRKENANTGGLESRDGINEVLFYRGWPGTLENSEKVWNNRFQRIFSGFDRPMK